MNLRKHIQIITIYKPKRLTSGSRCFVKGGFSGYLVTKLPEIQNVTSMFLNITFSDWGYIICA